MKEFEYDINTKDKCWYKSICDHSKCGNEFCIRHYKIDALTYMATLEGKQKYPVQLKPDVVDLEAFKKLKNIKTNIKDFVESGKNLLIYSEHTGNGKTEWLKKLLLAYFDSIWPFTDIECRGLFISMPKFISAMKANISKEDPYYKYVMDNIIDADVVIFDEDTPYELIKKIQPDVLVKGGDYNPDNVVGKDIVEARGGELKLLHFVEGKSTTNIIKKIKQ